MVAKWFWGLSWRGWGGQYALKDGRNCRLVPDSPGNLLSRNKYVDFLTNLSLLCRIKALGIGNYWPKHAIGFGNRH